MEACMEGPDRVQLILDVLHHIETKILPEIMMAIILSAGVVFVGVALLGFTLFAFAHVVKEVDAYLKKFSEDISQIQCPALRRIFVGKATTVQGSSSAMKGFLLGCAVFTSVTVVVLYFVRTH
jgi:hypothetical protein